MTKFKIILMAVMASALTFGFAGLASAASIGCGQCHGTAAISSNPAEQASTYRTGFSSANIPVYEDNKTPVDEDACGNGRGLHGIHMNYSSASYGGNGTVTRSGVTSVRHGNCNYCHNKHPHENGFIEFSGMSATARQKVSSLGVTFTGTGMVAGKGVDMTLMDGTGTCTKACHAGTSVANPAAWGNYTATVNAPRLSCDSCHEDGAGAASLTGAHAAHVGSAITVPGGTLMNAANNAGCVNCHTNNTGEGKAARDTGMGANRAYPHASDGTVVVSDAATLQGNVTSATKNGLNTTCATACHPRSNIIASPITWGGTLSCDMCHYGTGGTNTGTGAITGAHDAHLNAGKTCANCHGTLPTDTAHVSGLPIVADNATLATEITAATKNGLNTTCTTTCHPRSNLIASPITWGGSYTCDMCHYYDATPTGAENSAIATGSLPGAHNIHIDGGYACTVCHTVPANLASHNVTLPMDGNNASVLGAVNYSGGLAGTCQNSCHAATSAAWSTTVKSTGCATCHNYPGAAVGQGDWALTTNGHTVRASIMQNATTTWSNIKMKHLNIATAYNTTADSYAGVTGDAYKCGTCHSGASHMNGTKDVTANNGLGDNCNTNFTFNAATTISTPSATHSNATCSNTKCHFGRSTPNWN